MEVTVGLIAIIAIIVIYFVIKIRRRIKKRRQEKQRFLALIKQRAEIEKVQKTINDHFVRLDLINEQFWAEKIIQTYREKFDNLTKQANYSYELEQLLFVNLELCNIKIKLEKIIISPQEYLTPKYYDPITDQPLDEKSINLIINHSEKGRIILLVNQNTTLSCIDKKQEEPINFNLNDTHYNHFGFISGAGYLGPYKDIFAIVDCETIKETIKEQTEELNSTKIEQGEVA